MREDPADPAGATNFLSYRDGAIRRGPPNIVGVTNLAVSIYIATLGGRPADPVGATSLPISIKKPAPAGSSLGPIRMTNLPVFVGLTPLGGGPCGAHPED